MFIKATILNLFVCIPTTGYSQATMPISLMAKAGIETEVTELAYLNDSVNPISDFSICEIEIHDNLKINKISNSDSEDSLFLKGRYDAKRNYKGYSGAGTATFITSMLFLPAGLGCAINYSTKTPNENLGIKDFELYKNIDYKSGYLKQAKKIRGKKGWTNFSFAVGIYLVPTIVLFSAFNQ